VKIGGRVWIRGGDGPDEAGDREPREPLPTVDTGAMALELEAE
jgi:hypothetical protein